MKASSLLRFLYNHNPFYVISTCFVLYGLLAAFAGREMNADTTWLLAKMLTGYALLLAVTGYLVVKLGHVWEDARSIVLLVLLLFFAMSVGFDYSCVTLPETAWRVLAAGFGFAVAVTEGLLFGLRLKFPGSFRAAYYACLGLMFFYPLYIAEAARDLATETAEWRIYGFAALAGLVTLLLIPAASRGANYVAKNGTPWNWPWYPWPAFVFLGVGLAIRIYALHLSFVPIDEMKHGFGWYFLTPLLFAWWCVLLVIGLAGKNRQWINAMLWTAPLLLLTTIPGHGYWHDRFLVQFSTTIGSPLWLALWSLVAFYGLAWSSGERRAEWGIAGSLILLCSVPRSAGLTWEPVSPMPLIVLAVMQLAMFAWRQNVLRGWLGITCLAAAATIAARGTGWQWQTLVIAAHGVLFTMLLLGALYDDRSARLLRLFSAVGIALCGIASVVASLIWSLPDAAMIGYPVAMALAAFAYAQTLRERPHLAAGMANLCCACAVVARHGFESMYRTLGPEATFALHCGGAFFLVATIISAVKGGVWRRLWIAWWYGKPSSPETG